MSTDTISTAALHNGRAATAEDLAPLAFAGYAHFTAMQVRGGRVRGLDLHLDRLRSASIAMFGRALPDETVREHLRDAMPGASDLSLTATIHSAEGEFTAKGNGGGPEILVRTGPPASGPGASLALAAFEHERALPAIKHVGEVAKTWFLRQAVAQGYDDAAFLDRRGRLSEASIWNLAFWDEGVVVWPDADMLEGVTMRILKRQLERLGVAQEVRKVTLDTVPRLGGCVVMNSWTPGVAVSRIGAAALPDAPAFVELLQHAYEAEPLQAP